MVEPCMLCVAVQGYASLGLLYASASQFQACWAMIKLTNGCASQVAGSVAGTLWNSLEQKKLCALYVLRMLCAVSALRVLCCAVLCTHE